MDALLILAIPACLILIIIFSPDLFPKCFCCNAIKFRLAFSIHKTVNIGLGRSANRSVCKKCCKKYNIKTLEDAYAVNRVKAKVRSSNTGL